MPIFSKLTRTLLTVFLICGGLYLAKNFLVPIVFGGMFAMLLTPICSWLEKKGIAKALSAFICVFLFVAVIVTVVFLLSWQMTGLADDAGNVVILINKASGLVQDYIFHTLGLPVEKQKQLLNEQASGLLSKAMNNVAFVLSSAASIVGVFVLVVVYIFLFIYYRAHLSNFILKIVSEENRARTEKIMASGGQLAQKYVSGLGLVIVILWMLYSIGFSIVGVKHALFFAVFCGLLEIIPYVGNFIVVLLTSLIAFSQGGFQMALWVLAVYGVIQFAQNYILEPLIVGAKVSINPLCTIAAIIIGEMLWGVPGMVLAIPLLGIAKILCDNIPGLEAFGYLIGEIKHPKRK